MSRALRLRCPACGARGVLVHWLEFRAACPACGQPVERAEEGHYLGSLLLNFIVAELALALVAGVVIVATWPRVPWNAVLYGGAVLMVAGPFALYPFSKLVWLALDLWIQPEDEGLRARRP